MRSALARDFYEEESWRCCTESQRMELDDEAWSWAARLSPDQVREYYRDLRNKYTA
jgi:hypothetical protein